MPNRQNKWKGGCCDEWSEETPAPPGAFPAAKHADDHIELTGDSTAFSKVYIRQSPTKPRLAVKHARGQNNNNNNNNNDLDYSIDFGLGASNARAHREPRSVTESVDSDDDKHGDPELSLPSTEPDPAKESIPNLDPSPYEFIWAEDESNEKSNGDKEGGLKRQRKDTVRNIRNVKSLSS
jgi:hypothetical protein